MRILVAGTGYIGGRLVPRLLAEGHTVRCIAREPAGLRARFPQAQVVAGDVRDATSLEPALEGIETAFYLIHSMSGAERDFERSDREAAGTFAKAAALHGVQRIVYLGGLGEETAKLSSHLRSRQEVGEILRSVGVCVTEFRAAVIVGSGSVSFEMIRYLTDRLPLMIAPKWVATRCQPISVHDVLAYLLEELTHERTESTIYEIGGSDVLSYKEMMLRYASIRGLWRRVLVVPFFTPRLSSAWVHLVTPIPASLARPLIDGLMSEVVVRDDRASRDFSVRPMGYDDAVRDALNRYVSSGPETTWFDAYIVRALPGEFSGVTEGMLIDRRQRDSSVPAAKVFAVFSSLGGERGWLYADWLWKLRGSMDRLVGGTGIRRGRRSATDLREGDAVDFWRVERYEPGALLRLRAEMRLPGKAWLQFEAIPRSDGGSTLRQTAFFEPQGLLGSLYWYAVVPLHTLIFGTMASRIVEEASRLP